METLPVADYSKEAIEKNVVSRTLQKIYVTYPVLIGVVGAGGGYLLTMAPLMYAGSLAAFGGISLWVFDYFFRYDENARAYIDAVRDSQRKYLAEMPDRLRKELLARGSERGVRQIDELEKSFKDFQELLRGKFSANGLTLGRFQIAVEQVRAGALEKLQSVIDNLQAIESIPADLETQLRRSKANDKAAEHMRERVEHRKEALARIDSLYADVEDSLSRISEMTLRVANVGTAEQENGFENFLDELRKLAAQAPSFQKET